MIRAALTPPWVKMSEASLPTSWADARDFTLANAPWIFLLLAGERAFDGHYKTAGIALLLCFVSFGVAIYRKAFHGLTRPEGRRRLAFILITLGGAILAAGIYLLAIQSSPTTPRHDTAVHEDHSVLTPSDPAKEKELSDLREIVGVLQKAVSDKQKELNDLRQSQVATGRYGPNAKDPYAQGPILSRKFTSQEAQLLIDKLTTLREATKRRDTFQLEGLSIGSYRSPTKWAAEIAKMGVDMAILNLSDARDKTARRIREIDDVTKTVPADYSGDFIRIIGNPRLKELLAITVTYIDTLTEIKAGMPGGISEKIISSALRGVVSDFDQAIKDTNRWDSSFEDRAADARRQLEAFL